MSFQPLAGNAALKAQLSARTQGRGLSHAYLISGPAGSGKRTLARLLAAAMVCTETGEQPCGLCPGCRKALAGIHPDVVTVGGDGKGITVAQARAARSDAYVRPNEAPRKVYLFLDAQDMNPAAQNALLKLLEEGPPYAAFLLLTDNPGALLPTVRSRCEALALSPVTREEAETYLRARFPDASPEAVWGAAAACGGLLGQAVAQLEGGGDTDEVKAQAGKLLELLAGGDELALAAWCVGLEKWDRETLSRLLTRAAALLRDALALQAGAAPLSGPEPLPAIRAAAGLPRKKLLTSVQTLADLAGGLDFNLGPGHLCGALCARLSGA